MKEEHFGRIRVKAPGIYGADGELGIGTEFELKSAPPEGWTGRYDVVRKGPPKGAVAVTNPAGGEGEGQQEPGPLDKSIPDLVEHLKTVDDADEVQKLIDDETAGKSRRGALDALEARRDELLEA